MLMFFEHISNAVNMDQTSLWPLLVCFCGSLFLSVWGSGLNPFGKPRWVRPRTMLANDILRLLDFIFLLLPYSRKITQGKKPHIYFHDYHREHNTFTHRLNEWLLHLSDHENLTFEQKNERIFWTGGMLGGSVILLFVLISFFVRAVS